MLGLENITTAHLPRDNTPLICVQDMTLNYVRGPNSGR